MVKIDNVDFEDLAAERFWSFPPSQKARAPQETRNMIFSNDYLGARKIDGVYARFIKGDNGEMKLQPRNEGVNGGYPNKIEWVPQLQPLFDIIPNGSCLIGELYFPDNEGSRNVTTIMGCLKDKAIKRQQEKEALHYYIFDIWAWEGESYLKTTAEVRFSKVCALGNTEAYNHCEYVHFAKYFFGKSLWEELINVRDAGGEGIVITKANSVPEPGKRTARKTLKIKKELDNPIDCFLTGRYKEATRDYKGAHIEEWKYWQDLRTGEKKMGLFSDDYKNGEPIEPISRAYYNGWASAIEIGVVREEKIFSLGWISGIEDEVKAGIVQENEKWKHRVVKVNAMELDPVDKTLRHGRIVEWRLDGDKSWKECSYEQLE